MGGQDPEHWLERSRPAVAPDLSSFEGERYLTGIVGEIEAEHLHRYLFAAGLCAGRDVLDIACGEGYGSAILARVASSVAGVDIDEATIERACEAYPLENVEFEPGTCEAIPYKRDSFDVVVSFETIEHIDDQAKFLREIRRVLRPGGLLICSTPDKAVYKAGQEPNPFHKREMTRDEFESMLGAKFEHVRISGQRLVSGSVIARDGAGRAQLLETRDGFGFTKRGADEGATYLIAVCSDARLPRIDQSVMSDIRYSIGRVTSLEAREQELLQRALRAESVVSEREIALADSAQRLEEAERRAAEAMEGRDRATAARTHAEEERARLAEDRGRLIAEREAAERERDGAIRDAAAAHLEYERAVAVLDRVRAEMIEAREKAASAQASEAASRAERETLVASTAKAIDAKDAAVEARRIAEVKSARAVERARLAEAERARAEASAKDAERQARASEARAAGLEGAHARAQRAMDELQWMRSTRSWRWSRPLRLMSAAGRGVGIKSLGLSARLAGGLGLPGRERLLTARRAAMFRGSRLFDPGAYLRANPDVAASGADPAWHYAARGGIERRPTGGGFDTGFYLDSYPDVASSGVHPLEHYLGRGQAEGRLPAPPSRPTVAAPADVSKPAPASPSSDGARIAVRAPVPEVVVDAGQLSRTKALAFYLPQYHPTPENDAWWGKGFTEWSNVTRGRPMFPGHAQPMLPGELGFYDLRLPEVRERQAQLARDAGIYGFCYYHYWFNGRRVLERPLDEVVASASPDFPFCVCWANENWTRRWDGLEQEILLRQKHSLSSDRAFILDLLPYLEDPRYVRVGGRAVVLVYRPDLMVNAQDTAAVWRDECRRAGIGEIHLCAVQFRTGDPRPLGFDAAVEFPPHHFPAPEITGKVEGLDASFGGMVADYDAGARELIRAPRKADYRLYRGVMPSWDNTARRMEQGSIFHGSSPALYEAWLRSAINQRQPDDGIEENLVFINAWNEWAEGAVLEPRRDLGDAYLRATARALGIEPTQASTQGLVVDTAPSVPHADQPAEAGEHTPQASDMVPALTLEQRLKRLVRTNPRLNSFVNRHPNLKNRAASLLRLKQNDNGVAAQSRVPSLPSKKLWARGSEELVEDSARSLLIVSHDACLAGAQLVVLELLRELARDPSVRVYHLVCGGGVLEGDMRRLATTCSLEDLMMRGLSRAKAIRIALDSLPGRVDLALCNTAATTDVLAACAARGMETISYLHELPTTIDTLLGGEETVRTISRHADRIVVVSDFVRNKLCARYGLDAGRLEVIHMGLFPSKREPPHRAESRRAVCAELGIDTRTPIVLGCGTIHHRKGTDLWVAAAARAVRAARASDRPEPCFVWVGPDQNTPDLREWCLHHAEAAGVGDRIHFLGPRLDSSRYFAAADVFSLPSREDPFPLVSLEAMACGIPVIAFDNAGGAAEALRVPDSEAGLIVPFGDAAAMGDAIMCLLGDDSLASRLGNGGREVMREMLGWNRYMNALLGGLSPAPGEHASASEVEPKPLPAEPASRPAPDVLLELSVSKPRLVVISHDACLGGAQHILLENLRHWTRAGVDCRAVLLAGGVLTESFEAVCDTTVISGDAPAASGRLRVLLDNWEAGGWTPDAAYCNTTVSVGAMETLNLRGVPVVSALYELPTSIDTSMGGAETVERIMRSSQRIMVASGFVRDRLTQAYDVDAARLEAIHTGVLTRKLPDRDNARQAIRRELGVSADSFLVLGCGAIHQRKGTDLFVSAAAEAIHRAGDREIVFVWIGHDQDTSGFSDWCRHDAERLGVLDRVRFVGIKDNPGMWYAGADAFALTSREDPYPMVNLEALAAGLGVVAFDGAGGAIEALLDPEGDRGIIVPYMDTNAMGQALAELANDGRKLELLRRRALDFASEHLGWDRYMDDIGEMLASCSPAFAALSETSPEAVR